MPFLANPEIAAVVTPSMTPAQGPAARASGGRAAGVAARRRLASTFALRPGTCASSASSRRATSSRRTDDLSRRSTPRPSTPHRLVRGARRRGARMVLYTPETVVVAPRPPLFRPHLERVAARGPGPWRARSVSSAFAASRRRRSHRSRCSRSYSRLAARARRRRVAGRLARALDGLCPGSSRDRSARRRFGSSPSALASWPWSASSPCTSPTRSGSSAPSFGRSHSEHLTLLDRDPGTPRRAGLPALRRRLAGTGLRRLRSRRRLRPAAVGLPEGVIAVETGAVDRHLAGREARRRPPAHDR